MTTRDRGAWLYRLRDQRGQLDLARDRSAGRTLALTIALVAIALLSILPLWLVLSATFKTQVEFARDMFGPSLAPTLDNLAAAWEQARIGTFMRNSLVVSVGTVGLGIAAATLLAFAIEFLEWPGRRFAMPLCLVLLAIPSLLLMLPMFRVFIALRLINTHLGLVLLYAAHGVPFAVFLLATYMRGIPRSVIEAAVIDGASAPRVLWRIVVPMSRPALATAATIMFLTAWNEFIYAFVLIRNDELRTLPAGLAALQDRYFTNYPVLFAGILLSVLPVIGVYLLAQRYLVRGIAAGVD
jgi:ABC-type glycerol-3-phosphate transport system permease component